VTIDVWMQHPTVRFLRSDMLAPLRRWTGGSLPDTDIPIGATVAVLDDVGLNNHQRREFLRGSAERVFRLEANR